MMGFIPQMTGFILTKLFDGCMTVTIGWNKYFYIKMKVMPIIFLKKELILEAIGRSLQYNCKIWKFSVKKENKYVKVLCF